MVKDTGTIMHVELDVTKLKPLSFLKLIEAQKKTSPASRQTNKP